MCLLLKTNPLPRWGGLGYWGGSLFPCRSETRPDQTTLCYALVLAGRKSGLRAGFEPDFSREGIQIGITAGRRPDFDVYPIGIRPKSCPEARFQARKHYCLTGPLDGLAADRVSVYPKHYCLT